MRHFKTLSSAVLGAVVVYIPARSKEDVKESGLAAEKSPGIKFLRLEKAIRPSAA